VLPGVEQTLPHDGLREIPVRLLGERQVAVLVLVAEIGQRILVAAAPLDFAGVRQQQARLADQVEREVGETEVLFERRRVPDPFAETLTEHEARVAETQQVLEQRGVHRFLTSSGIA
jgi:hypothetical protein